MRQTAWHNIWLAGWREKPRQKQLAGSGFWLAPGSAPPGRGCTACVPAPRGFPKFSNNSIICCLFQLGGVLGSHRMPWGLQPVPSVQLTGCVAHGVVCQHVWCRSKKKGPKRLVKPRQLKHECECPVFIAQPCRKCRQWTWHPCGGAAWGEAKENHRRDTRFRGSPCAARF